jgi:outer membrane protein assembly factor BamE (lipoprotein component of BamABCDE complex)
MPGLRLSMLPFAIYGVMALAACATSVEQRGNLPPADEIAQIHPGKTTKDQVIKILGSPSSVSVFTENNWYYVSAKTKQYTFFEPKVLDQEVYVVDFNSDGVVQAVEHKTLADGKSIQPVARATPAPGRELSFIEQIIGNLGKFNGGGGGGGGETGPASRAPGPAPYSNE